MRIKEYLDELEELAFLFHIFMIGAIPFLIGLALVYYTFGMLYSFFAYQEYFFLIVIISFNYSFIYGYEFFGDKKVRILYLTLFPLFFMALPFTIFVFFYKSCDFCNNRFAFPPGIGAGITFYIICFAVCLITFHITNKIREYNEREKNTPTKPQNNIKKTLRSFCPFCNKYFRTFNDYCPKCGSLIELDNK